MPFQDGPRPTTAATHPTGITDGNVSDWCAKPAVMRVTRSETTLVGRGTVVRVVTGQLLLAGWPGVDELTHIVCTVVGANGL